MLLLQLVFIVLRVEGEVSRGASPCPAPGVNPLVICLHTFARVSVFLCWSWAIHNCEAFYSRGGGRSAGSGGGGGGRPRVGSQRVRRRYCSLSRAQFSHGRG